jgi:hypothetical protein
VIWRWVPPSRFGRRDIRAGPRGRSFELASAAGRCGIAGGLAGVVIVELALSLLGEHSKGAKV